MKTIIFDFDKTLTYKDTMNQLFIWRMKGFRLIYWPIFLFLIFLVKLKIITIKKLKEVCIKLLFPNKQEDILSLCKVFSKEIELTQIANILEKKIKEGERVIILSASPIYYLQEIFPEIEIIATTFIFNSQKAFNCIKEHPYGKNKYKSLIERNITIIDELYYDSQSDEELFPLCKVAYKIANGNIIKVTRL